MSWSFLAGVNLMAFRRWNVRAGGLIFIGSHPAAGSPGGIHFSGYSVLASSLSTSSPFAARFLAYLQERFSLLNGLRVLILFATCYTLAAHLGAPDRPVVLYPKLLV